MPFRIETDAHLRRALGTDGAEWAEAYINQQQHTCGDARHVELTAWFDAALGNGRAAAGGAPDQETADLMDRLSDLQAWCALMTRKDSGGIEASRLVQDTRAFIVERLYPRAKAYREARLQAGERR